MFEDATPGSPEDELRRILGMQPRGLGSVTPQPPPTSSGIVPAAAKAMPSLIAAPGGGPPPIVPQQRQTDETELNRLKNSPSGIDQFREKHPIIGTIAKIGEIAGSSLFPGVAAQIPGTDLHHSQLLNQQQSRVKQDLAGEHEQAQTAGEVATAAHEQAETGAIPSKMRLEKAQADALENPQSKATTPDEVTLHDLMAGNNGQPRLNPQTSKPYTYLEAYTAVKQAAATKQEKPDNPEQQFTDEFQRTHPGASIAQAQRAHVLNQQAPQQPQQPQRVLGVTPDHKVIEITPGMSLPEGTQTVGGEIKADTAGQAAKDALAYATDYLASKKFTGAGDEALMEKYFELAKPSSGFRMTQPQIEMLTKAQDVMNSVVAKGKHLFSPEAPYFSTALRQQIVDTMTRIEGSKGANKAKPGAGEQVVEYVRGADGKLHQK